MFNIGYSKGFQNNSNESPNLLFDSTSVLTVPCNELSERDIQ